jgi:hypothetical protein
VVLAGAVNSVQFINITGMNTTAQVDLPALGVGSSSNLTIMAASSLGEQIVTQVTVRGVITTRAALQSLLSYPATVMGDQMFSMNLSNLTQGCGDGYSITLRDPTNTTDLVVANNSSFSGSSSQSGNNPVVLVYTTDLGTVYSDSQYVSLANIRAEMGEMLLIL